MQAPHAFASGAEHQRGAALEVAQHVHGRALGVVRCHGHSAVFDVAVRLAGTAYVNPKRVPLVTPGEGGDLLGDGGAEHQGAALLGGRGVQDELEVFAEAQIEHLVRLVQHCGAERGQVQPSALEMVTQPSRGADHDVTPGGQHTLLGAAIHPPHARRDFCTRLGVEPGKLTLDLDRQLPRGGDDKGQGCAGAAEALVLTQQRGGKRQAVRDGLARAGLGRDQQVPAGRFFDQDRNLHAGRLGIIPGGKRAAKGRID